MAPRTRRDRSVGRGRRAVPLQRDAALRLLCERGARDACAPPLRLLRQHRCPGLLAGASGGPRHCQPRCGGNGRTPRPCLQRRADHVAGRGSSRAPRGASARTRGGRPAAGALHALGRWTSPRPVDVAAAGGPATGARAPHRPAGGACICATRGRLSVPDDWAARVLPSWAPARDGHAQRAEGQDLHLHLIAIHVKLLQIYGKFMTNCYKFIANDRNLWKITPTA